MLDLLSAAYPWTKALHVISVIAWMAGLLYLPRLYVYHAERAGPGSELAGTLKEMERRLLRAIMNPAMAATWLFGLSLAATPGVVDWGAGWFYLKAALIVAMTWYHHLLAGWRKRFEADANTRSGRFYRLWNEAPALMMAAIVILVIVRPF